MASMPKSEIRLMPGSSGWVQVRFEERGRRRLYVRFEPDAQGNWKPAEWRIPGNYPADVLRKIPFHRVEAALAANENVKDELAARFKEPGKPGFSNAYGEVRREAPITIKRPSSHRLDDSFYQQVGFVYRQAVGRGFNPRQAIADAANVSPDVAGRWIYQARKRGFIPKTRAGKVTV